MRSVVSVHRLFLLHRLNQLNILPSIFAQVWIMTIVRLGLKVKVKIKVKEQCKNVRVTRVSTAASYEY